MDHEHQRQSVITTKKGKKASKLYPAPVSFADGSRSPRHQHRNAPNKERFSGLWEFYYDSDGEEGRERGGEEVMGRGGRGGDEEREKMRNIRGFLFKRRKSPLKGWHKRYFTLEEGILTCARNPVQMNKGKVLSRTDLGFAVITCDSTRWKIDIDEERQVYHLKTKNASHFAAWSACLLAHEMWRKARLSGAESLDQGNGEEGRGGEGRGMERWMEMTQETINSLKNDLESVKESLEALGVCVKSPLQKTNDPSFISTDSGCEGVGYHQQNSGEGGGGGGGGGGKEKKRWGRRKHDKRNKDTSATAPVLYPDQQSVSLPSIPVGTLPLPEEAMEENILRDDFTATATAVFSHFNEMMDKWEKIQKGFEECMLWEHAERQHRETLFNNQQLMLRQSLLHNTELKSRLSQIHTLTADVGTPPLSSCTSSLKTSRPRTPAHSQSLTTSSVSNGPRYGGKALARFDSFASVRSALSETFFDALDDVHESSEEEEEEEDHEGEDTIEEEHEATESEGDDSGEDLYASFSTEVLRSISLSPRRGVLSTMKEAPLVNGKDSDSVVTVLEEGSPIRKAVGLDGLRVQQRRSKLPRTIPDIADISLWSILRRNIGKDLSRVSMPVSLNEPLSALQRLCEEVQYSELLDQAAALDDPCDRMVRIAAFAVSAYVTAFHRPARKPFNPLLGETFEWIREDKGFRFVAEQVSHHPPIAACHCESPNFTFWQDARIKSKFWGKSMEVFPVGTVNVTLPKHGDHYQWEKVTSCIHNVLGGQRWVDQYGQMTITNKGKCSCKLTFVKASYWSSKKYEVHGDVYNSEGERVRHLFGTWHEAMYCGQEGDATCIWKAASMPANSDQYYGFNQFAIQLNGFEDGMKDKLPQTDSRFRPDQRLLEEGFIERAEEEKHRVEQLQRQARAERERVGVDWTPVFFKKETNKGAECWVSCGTYWKQRETNFQDVHLPTLW